jgi:hypothetical protein
MKSYCNESPANSIGNGPTVLGTLINHEGRISSLETTRDQEPKPRFEVTDLMSFLPGLIANALAFALLWAGKISVIEWLSATGSIK